MKKIFFLASLITLSLNYTAQEQSAITSKTYTSLTEERFNQIEDLLSEQPELIPIKIEEVPRGELIKFYIKSYNDDIVSTWMEFALKKMKNAKVIDLESKQYKALKSYMTLERNRANMFQFMSSLTNEQITAIGF